jgi:hypothetical protein
MSTIIPSLLRSPHGLVAIATWKAAATTTTTSVRVAHTKVLARASTPRAIAKNQAPSELLVREHANMDTPLARVW